MKKPISTDPTPENIRQILQLLTEVPIRLEKLSQGMDETALHQPMAPDKRSFHRTLAHLIHCESRTFEAITQALLANEPTFPAIHPEREFGNLFPFVDQPFPDLLAYFKIRRAVLLAVLTGLSEKQWARAIQPSAKQRKETVYWQARGQALHEWEHVEDLAKKLV